MRNSILALEAANAHAYQSGYQSAYDPAPDPRLWQTLRDVAGLRPTLEDAPPAVPATVALSDRKPSRDFSREPGDREHRRGLSRRKSAAMAYDASRIGLRWCRSGTYDADTSIYIVRMQAHIGRLQAYISRLQRRIERLQRDTSPSASLQRPPASFHPPDATSHPSNARFHRPAATPSSGVRNVTFAVCNVASTVWKLASGVCKWAAPRCGRPYRLGRLPCRRETPTVGP